MSYHDYVIKDGKFIGKFDEMYSRFDDPWMQSRQPNPFSRSNAILSMKDLGIKSLLEVGSGLGYYSDRIHRETGIRPRGIDISPVAVEKARTLFPHLEFEVGNVRERARHKDVDAVLFAEVMWYVLEDLPFLLEEMGRHFQGKYFFNLLVFYKGSQRYGTQYFTNLKEFIEYIPFKLVAYSEASREQDTTIETHTVFQIEPR